MAHRKGRSALTGLGIVLGVAIFFGVLVANATTQASVDDLVEGFTGRADVLIEAPGAFDAELPPAIVDRVRALPDVEAAVGSLSFSSTLRTLDAEHQVAGLWATGIEPDLERGIQNFVPAAGRLLTAGRDEVLLGRQTAEDLGVGPGDTVEVRGSGDADTLLVTGVLDRVGAGRGDGGAVAYTTLEVARRLDARDAEFNRVSVVLRDGTDAAAWIDSHRIALEGTLPRDTETLAQGFRNFLEVFGTFLTFFAAVTLFVGAFLIYLTLSMAVVERIRVYGTLRALGASRRQVRRVVLVEALTLSVVATVVGLGLGLLLAKGLLALISAVLDLQITTLAVTPGAVFAGILVGLVTTLGSALLPALRAARLAPITAMKGDHATELRLGRGWIVGAVVLCLSVALVVATNGQGLGSLGTLGVLLGAVLLVPLLLRPLAAVLGGVTNRIARGVGDIAVLHLAKERSRSAYTLALIMVVMSMLLATGGLYRSVRAGFDEFVDRQFGSDLFIDGEGPLSDDLVDTIRAHPDIAAASPLWFGGTSVIEASPEPGESDREDVIVAMIDPATYFELSGFFWQDGDDGSAAAALHAGGAVLMPAGGLTDDLGAGQGDSIVVETTRGRVPFVVAATHAAQPGPPRITVSAEDGRRFFGAGQPMAFVAEVREGVDLDAVASQLEGAPGSPVAGRLHVETAADSKAQVRDEIGQFFQIIFAILFVAAIVGLLGLANTLAMSVLRRFREIGILRALGVTRAQVWRMVLVESSTMAVVAFVLSIPLGFLLTWVVTTGTREAFGFTFPTLYPWTWIPVVAAFGSVVATLAAFAPGRRAASLQVVGALQYE